MYVYSFPSNSEPSTSNAKTPPMMREKKKSCFLFRRARFSIQIAETSGKYKWQAVKRKLREINEAKGKTIIVVGKRN